MNVGKNSGDLKVDTNTPQGQIQIGHNDPNILGSRNGQGTGLVNASANQIFNFICLISVHARLQSGEQLGAVSSHARVCLVTAGMFVSCLV